MIILLEFGSQAASCKRLAVWARQPIAGYPGGVYRRGYGAAAVGAAAAGAAYYGGYGYYNSGCYQDAYGNSVCPQQASYW